MSLLSYIRHAMAKRKFEKSFHPLGMKKKQAFLVSISKVPDQVIETLAFLNSLRARGDIIALIPHTVSNFYHFLKQRYFETEIYNRTGRSSKEQRKALHKRLQKQRFDFLIELNSPADRLLPSITPIEKRVCFYHKDNFPFYNIMMKDGFTSLHEFFNAEKTDPAKALSFVGHPKSQVFSRFGKQKPLCIVNGTDPKDWSGDILRVGPELSKTDPELVNFIRGADCYCGAQDILYQFARLFSKKIIEP